MSFNNSVVEYKDRGNYGNNKYRGNTSGLIVKDFLESFHKDKTKIFCDPAEGGKTSRDVANEMNIPYKGYDLRDGFNLLKDDLGQKIGDSAQSIFFHPPYFGCIKYSGNMWGQSAHPDDLSQATSLEDFMAKIQLALWNIYDAVASKGFYGVLIGNWRNQGTYYPLCSLIEVMAPGKLKEEIIKVQNNVTSNSFAYASRNFVPIMHEKLLIFEKDKMQCSLDYTLDIYERAIQMNRYTWKNLIKRVMMRNPNKQYTLEDIYSAVDGTPKAKSNPNWQAKVRQIMQDSNLFTRLDRGVYALAA